MSENSHIGEITKQLKAPLVVTHALFRNPFQLYELVLRKDAVSLSVSTALWVLVFEMLLVNIFLPVREIYPNLPRLTDSISTPVVGELVNFTRLIIVILACYPAAAFLSKRQGNPKLKIQIISFVLLLTSISSFFIMLTQIPYFSAIQKGFDSPDRIFLENYIQAMNFNSNSSLVIGILALLIHIVNIIRLAPGASTFRIIGYFSIFFIGGLIVSILYTILFLAISHQNKNGGNFQHEETVNSALEQKLANDARELNLKTPIMADQVTRLDNVSVSGLTLTMSHTLVNYELNQQEINSYKDDMFNMLKEQTCTGVWRKDVNLGAVIEYVYFDKKKNLVASITIRDCKKQY